MNDRIGKMKDIQRSLASHQQWRGQTLNLIASENVLSETVRGALDNDLLGRYADYTARDMHERRYRGTRYIEEIEDKVYSLAQKVFNARFIELRPVSGHIAGAAVLLGLCQPGDTVLELGKDAGGHREAAKFNQPSLLDLDVRYLPFNAAQYNVDVPATIELIKTTQPKVVILGTSNFLFPHPVGEIKQAIQQHSHQTILVYDASHVMGFLASGRFQAPLVEGADIVFGSTHKTFPGPQGGIIFTNRGDLIDKISEAVYPALVTNHHPFRMPALGLALVEMSLFGAAFMDQVIKNSQALGERLEAEGVPCVQWNGRFSLSHTVLVRLAELNLKTEAAAKLEQANIITTEMTLPDSLGKYGIRLGTQEITRLGAKEVDMSEIARLISTVLHEGQTSLEVRMEVETWMARFQTVHYTWDVQGEG